MNVAEIQLKYNNKMKLKDSFKILDPSDVVDFMRKRLKDDLLYREVMYAIYLNNSNRVKGVFRASEGGVSGTVFDQKVILGIALKSLSSGLILVHNHPSGNTKPSKADIKITEMIKRACEYMDIRFLDHIIITEDNYKSITI